MSVRSPSSCIRVIGVGSPFGADRVGWLATEWLAEHPAAELQGVAFITSDRPGIGLLQQMRGAELVFVIDALAGGVRGRIRELTPEQLAGERAALSNHGIGVAEALALGRTLNDLPPRLVLLGIECDDLNGEPRFERAALLDTVLQRLRPFLSSHSEE